MISTWQVDILKRETGHYYLIRGSNNLKESFIQDGWDLMRLIKFIIMMQSN